MVCRNKLWLFEMKVNDFLMFDSRFPSPAAVMELETGARFLFVPGVE
jgi:hypothetical protein